MNSALSTLTNKAESLQSRRGKLRVATSHKTYGAVTPSDTTVLAFGSLYIGGAGNVSVLAEDGTTIVVFAAIAGAILPVAGVRVRATGTTATGIVWFA